MSNSHHRASRISSEGAASAASRTTSDASQEETTPRILFSSDSTNPDAPVTEDEYLQHLRKKECFGTAPQKKSKLLKALVHLEKIHEEINKKNQNLAKKFRENIPTEQGLKSPTKISLEKLAGMIWNMHKCMSHYKETDMKSRMSREFSNAWKKGFEECILEFIETAGNNALNARVTKFDKMKVNLTLSQKGRDYLKGGGFLATDPEGEVVEAKDCEPLFCAKCKHEYADFPPECKLTLKKNKQALELHRGEVTKAEQEKKKAPKAPKTELRYTVCHCHQFNCYGNSEGPGSTCIIKCIDPATGKKYPFNAQGECTCPLCGCQCAFAIKVSTTSAHSQLAFYPFLSTLSLFNFSFSLFKGRE